MRATKIPEPKWPTILLDNANGFAGLQYKDFAAGHLLFIEAANRLHAKGISGLSLKLGRHNGQFTRWPSGEFRLKGRLLADIHLYDSDTIICDRESPKDPGKTKWYLVRRETPLAAVVEFLEKRAKKMLKQS